MGHKIACLDCRKAFSIGADYPGVRSDKCPDCARPAIRLSHRFRPPKKTAGKRWEVARFLHQNGFDYGRLRQPGGAYVKYPNTMPAAKEFVVTYASQAREKGEK